MTTYTAYNDDTGEILGRGLTAEQAATERLTHDGGRFDLVVDADGSRIEGPDATGRVVTFWDGPAPHGKLLIDYQGSPAEQRARLFHRVLTADWRGPVRVVSDADYDAMMAEVEASA